jgi:hypothetical protein
MSDRLPMGEDERDRLRDVRRAWGAAFLGFGIFLLVCFVAGLLFLLWLWNVVKDSPTIS